MKRKSNLGHSTKQTKKKNLNKAAVNGQKQKDSYPAM